METASNIRLVPAAGGRAVSASARRVLPLAPPVASATLSRLLLGLP